VPARRGVVDGHPLAGLEVLHVGAHLAHHAHALVSRGQRELGEEATLMEVQVGAADTCQSHIHDDLAGSCSWPRNLTYAELAGRFVDQRAQSVHLDDATVASWLRM
jgi:hypothetical protein